MQVFKKGWLLGAALLMISAPALATIGPPVSMRLMGEPRPAKPGEMYHGSVEITVFETGELKNFHLEGKDWSALNVGAPKSLRLEANGKLEVSFTALPPDPVTPLELVLDYDGHRVSKFLDLSEEHFLRMTQGAPAEIWPGANFEPMKGRYGFEPVPEVPHDMVSPPTLSVQKGSRTTIDIRVHGRFGFANEFNMYRPAHRARVMVYARPPTETFDIVAVTTTDWNGFYDVTFTWDLGILGIDYPTIYLVYGTGNDWVDVRDGTFSSQYFWYGPSYYNFQGNDLEYPSLMASDHTRAAVFIQTNLTRAHIWGQTYPYPAYEIPQVGVQWPAGWGTGAWYTPGEHRIYLQLNPDPFAVPNPKQPEWWEGTQCHEYGHHWANVYTGTVDFTYCNPGGFCDPAYPDDCGHCGWCPENEIVAWMEGFASWFSNAITSTYQADWGEWPMHAYSSESLRYCSEDSLYYDPMITEGYLAALLQDISDNDQDTHGNFGWFTDQLAMGVDEILADVQNYNIHLVSHFLYYFANNHPIYRMDFWETAMNCGYQIDEEPPGAVTDLISTSHIPGVPSTDTTVDLNWFTAADDASGIMGYGVEVWPTSRMPPLVMNLGLVTSYTTESLGPGTNMYFNIVAIDRNGTWSNTYNSFGPIVIEASTTADVEFYEQAGWGEVVVPRASADASIISVPLPLSLPGNTNSTYWNVSGWNSGSTTTPSSFLGHIYVDGVYSEQAILWPETPGFTSFWALNRGPMTVSGGLHTFEAWLDAGEQIPELNEPTNHWAQQWVWTPQELVVNSSILRLAPPDRTGGWDHIRDGSLPRWNCEGLRFDSSGWWNAVVVRSLDNSVDYECQLFEASTGPRDGFDVPLAESSTPAGFLDAVLVNRNTMGNLEWNVGLINSPVPGTSALAVVHRVSEEVAVGDSITFNLAAAEMLRLYEFNVPPGDPLPVSIIVQGDPSDPVWALFYERTFTVGGLLDFDQWYTSTSGDGYGRMDVGALDPGYHCVAVYRDPINGYDPLEVTLEIEATPPNLTPLLASGWYRPLVPRPAFDGTPTQVDLPDTLHGNSLSTYLNLAFTNLEAAAAPASDIGIYVDGAQIGSLPWGPIAGDELVTYNWDQPWTVHGGRHLVAFRMDDGHVVEEVSEEDNAYGRQYCWSPHELSLFTPESRMMSPEAFGDRDIVYPEDLPVWHNCDGLRMQSGTDWWQAVVAIPGDDSNVDLRLHEPLAGVLDGFDVSLAFSGYWETETDYVMVNYNQTYLPFYDVGVVRATDVTGGEDYTVEVVSSDYYEFTGDNVYGPFTLDPYHLMHLLEFQLPVGPLQITLENVDGMVDWAISLHRTEEAYHSRSTYVTDGHAVFEGPGGGESISVDLTIPGYYALAVYKRNVDSMQIPGTYQIRVTSEVTDVLSGEVLPTRTSLAEIYPNPFNPQTRIVYDLAVASPVRLEIFDVQGTRVRTLIDEYQPAARYEVLWDGRNDAGHVMASGVYFARLAAEDVHEMRKVTLLK